MLKNKLKIVNLERPEILNNFLAEQRHSSFLQSWQWGEFQKKTGQKIIRLGFFDQKKLVAAATLVQKTLDLSLSYWYAPRGPVLGESIDINIIFQHIKELAKGNKKIFLRFEPNKEKLEQSFDRNITKTSDLQPSKTILLDLSRTQEDLMQNMHQKTRYNIRLATKKNVKIIQGSLADFDCFWELLQDTKQRDGFKTHDKNYYKAMLGELGEGEIKNYKNLSLKLLLAEFQGKIIAGGIFAFFGDTATYLHGASSNAYRNIMAPYLLQWEAIKLAQASGYRYYDFYGIDEQKWPGVTRFKQGFGGEIITYAGTFDFVFKPYSYKLYLFLRILNAKMRQFLNLF